MSTGETCKVEGEVDFELNTLLCGATDRMHLRRNKLLHYTHPLYPPPPLEKILGVWADFAYKHGFLDIILCTLGLTIHSLNHRTKYLHNPSKQSLIRTSSI